MHRILLHAVGPTQTHINMWAECNDSGLWTGGALLKDQGTHADEQLNFVDALAPEIARVHIGPRDDGWACELACPVADSAVTAAPTMPRSGTWRPKYHLPAPTPQGADYSIRLVHKDKLGSSVVPRSESVWVPFIGESPEGMLIERKD